MNIEGLDLKPIKTKLASFTKAASKYSVVIISVLVLILFGIIFWRITYYSELEPTPAMLDEQLKASTRPKIDPALVDKLESLESENVQVQTLFNEARQNPFSE